MQEGEERNEKDIWGLAEVGRAERNARESRKVEKPARLVESIGLVIDTSKEQGNRNSSQCPDVCMEGSRREDDDGLAAESRAEQEARARNEIAVKLAGQIMCFVEKGKGQIGDLLNFGTPKGDGWTRVVATEDSGSTETVTSEVECPGIETVESPQSKAGVTYEVANSETVANDGQKECEVMARGMAQPKGMDLQVAKVHKTLLSVGLLTKAGNTVVFSDVYGNYILHNHTGEYIPMRKVGALYEVDLWLRARKPSASTFTRQGS